MKGKIMFDIISLGETLIDFTSKGVSAQGAKIFEANPGGAPCNVLAAMSKIGKSCAFIGKVGNDMFGNTLIDTMKSLNIDTRGVTVSDTEFTTLAFVSLSENGDREFSFARKNSADVMLSEEEVDEEIIKNARILHIGTLSLTHPSARKATEKAVRIAKENGVIISCDPNIRLGLWDTPENAAEAIKYVLSQADIIKISDYETEFLYGSTDITECAKRVFNTYTPRCLFLTAGKNGAYMMTKNHFLHEPCLSGIRTVDTTGAGDCFCGVALYGLLENGFDTENYGEATCRDVLKLANTAANLSTERFGAIASMPTMEQILKVYEK